MIAAAKYVAVYIITAVVLAASLTASALIPRSALYDNMVSSARLLCQNRVFYNIFDDVESSKIDRYADSILLSISYQLDSEDPLGSAMRTAYYYTPYENENVNFRLSLENGFEANTQYMRYWHGSAIFVRLSHLFTDIKGMYVISALLIINLTALLLVLLIKNRYFVCAVGVVCAFAAVSIWFVPFSLEYTWVFIVTLVMSVITVPLARKNKEGVLLALFLVCGMVTNFLDFLTCETLTLLMPLLIAVYIRRGENVKNMWFSIKSAVLWGIGYVGIWVTKWISAAVVMGEDVTPYLSGHIAERFGVKDEELSPLFILEGLWKNITCLFPAGYGPWGILASVVILVGLAYLCFVYRKKGADGKAMLLYAVIGAVPFVRFIVLHNHANLHFFFAYRALAATVLAVCFIIAEIIGVGRVGNGTSERKKA